MLLGLWLLRQFPPSRYFPNCSELSNDGFLRYVTSIFGICRPSLAAMTCVKYGCGSTILTHACARSKIFLTEKLTNGALVTPTPGPVCRRLDLALLHLLVVWCMSVPARQLDTWGAFLKDFYISFVLTHWGRNKTGRHCTHAIFKCIFVDEDMWISINISLKFVPQCQINNIPALVQIMAQRRPGDKPLPEPMMVSLLTYICVSRPELVYRTHISIVIWRHVKARDAKLLL